jgi:hypothetical protein
MKLRGGKVVALPQPSQPQPKQWGGDLLRLLQTTAYNLYVDDTTTQIPDPKSDAMQAFKARARRRAERWLDMPPKKKQVYVKRAERQRAKAAHFKRFLESRYKAAHQKSVAIRAIFEWDSLSAAQQHQW